MKVVKFGSLKLNKHANTNNILEWMVEDQAVLPKMTVKILILLQVVVQTTYVGEIVLLVMEDLAVLRIRWLTYLQISSFPLEN